ncbi:MAG: efflux RND transporter periplasmic adaptor subunit [Lachnospiraceae bacterium]|nr:efflux RND transporter periplasmic adaptor subunit [Lachnospiraceae bacterium]
MKKKTGVIIAVSVVIVGIAAGGILWVRSRMGDGGGSADRVYVEQVAQIMQQSSGIGNRYMGVVESQDVLEVNRDSERTIREVQVAVGDEVEVGTVLFTYDTEDLQMQVSQAKLELESINTDIANYNAQIKELQAEKEKASEDQKFEYTTQIQTLQTTAKQSEYSKKSKQAEIDKLNKSINNSTVTSTIAGVVKSINESGTDNYGNTAAYMTILETGEYRVKGIVDEQTIWSLAEGDSMIVRSRVDDTCWTGSISKIDMENTVSENNNYYSNDEGESASKYNFYVSLDSADGLILGQHLYLEPDYGQQETVERDGVWLYSYYIDMTEEEPFVWMAGNKNRLEKRPIKLGEYDAMLDAYEITDGLSEDDYVAFPMEGMYEGITTVTDYEEIDYSSPLYKQEGDGMEEDFMEEDYLPEDTELLWDDYDTEVLE